MPSSLSNGLKGRVAHEIMNGRELRAEFESLLAAFEALREAAACLVTPNREDDVFVRAAIVGFARYCDPDTWARGHLQFIQKKRQGDVSDESLAFLYGPESNAYAILACLFLGALLGMFQAEKITEEEFRSGEALLPGFLAEGAGRLPVSR